jgi:hypothetical protein
MVDRKDSYVCGYNLLWGQMCRAKGDRYSNLTVKQTAMRKYINLILLAMLFSCSHNRTENVNGLPKTAGLDVQKKKSSDEVALKDTSSSSNPGPHTKTLRDTTVVLSFKDLSYVYNYKVIDHYFGDRSYYDSVARTIKIYTKGDSLVQKILPKVQFTPWYFHEHDLELRLSRSTITGKNEQYNDIDNYCGEIVVTDLNFDGFEDFATPVGSGADNGPHYAFYIQDTNGKFNHNLYLTKNLIWFPETINNSLMTFTTTVLCTAGTRLETFKYDIASKKWKKMNAHFIDIVE